MTWKIQATTGEFAGKSIKIDQDMLVGRHQDANILLQSAEISRRHAAFLLKDAALYLQDLNSSNGTFLNGERISTTEVALKSGDVVVFASLQFEVHQDVESNTVDTALEEVIVQPSEAVATSATHDGEVQRAAAQMNEQGMPSVQERAQDVALSHEGMPTRVAVPKPAPIPEGVDINVKAEPTVVAIPEPVSDVKQAEEEKKNTSVGLITIIALVILAVLAWFFLK
ncbi:FHA domain-containing protein [Acinetobacter rudis]|uniref:FHA domain-containing protein n=1 Tax=Acinetobacter rudis TaxID=632955 RepID=A0AAW8J763_9GAMM|nr:FHA domain-containing protein [Acinetobacter rudis]MDQ8935956.1 FHA domain-containing protein [Acinetobacter rudis]MDQ8953599.1 FHA domain-containing protein [Acinetobacter rudis]MDQ9018219.1 FHA domain-containing protein [Acinetobacter rudis]